MAACSSSGERYVHMDFKSSDVSFALKRYHPPPNQHRRHMTPKQMKADVFKSVRLQKMMAEVAEERDVEVEEVEKEVKMLVEEIGHKFFFPAIRTIALMLRGPIRKVLDAINVSHEGLEKVRHAVQQWPVLLLPSHRSYLDFILISYLLFEMNIQVPYIAAGQDFMDMKIVGSLLRRSGAFFLRRTFGSDQLYKLIFTLYTQSLMSSNMAPVEFFIEGTRSRTAKSLHPKLGMLSMVVEPYLNGFLSDLLMFPITISYERTLEEDLFSWELLGQPKPKESTKGLMRGLSLLREDYGSIYINIADPISLHDYCQQHGISRIPRGLAPRHEIALTPSERGMITDLGYTLIDLLEKNSVIFPSSLLASLLLHHHHYRTELCKDDLVKQMEWLKGEIERRGGVIHWPTDARTVTTSSLRLLSSCVEEEGERVKVCVHHTSGGGASHMSMGVASHKEVEEVMVKGAVHLKLAHYRNKLVHLFVPEAMLVMVLSCNEDVPRDQAMCQFDSLHSALSKEFVLPQHLGSRELFHCTLQQLVDRGVVHCEGVSLRVNGRQLPIFEYLAQVIRPFVAGVWILCHQLLSLKGGVQTLKRTYSEAQHMAAQLIHNGELNSFEPLSREMLRNAMTSLDSKNLILKLEHEFEGRDRLVKVAQEHRLQKLTDQLGAILYPGGHGMKLSKL